MHAVRSVFHRASKRGPPVWSFNATLHGMSMNMPWTISHEPKLNRWALVWGIGNGFLYDQIRTWINASTPKEETFELSPDGYPLIWMDVESDRRTMVMGGVRTGDPLISHILLGIFFAELDPAMEESFLPPDTFKLTGKTRLLYRDTGGSLEIPQVEIRIPIEKLSRCCYICGLFELASFDQGTEVEDVERMEVVEGPATSLDATFICKGCAKMSSRERNKRANRRKAHLDKEHANGLFCHAYAYPCFTDRED